jgi:hypothetical protein
MGINIIPTELEIEMQAAIIFPDSKEMQSSFILGVHHTIYYNIKIEKL